MFGEEAYNRLNYGGLRCGMQILIDELVLPEGSGLPHTHHRSEGCGSRRSLSYPRSCSGLLSAPIYDLWSVEDLREVSVLFKRCPGHFPAFVFQGLGNFNLMESANYRFCN
jgi:hypothetical protein